MLPGYSNEFEYRTGTGQRFNERGRRKVVLGGARRFLLFLKAHQIDIKPVPIIEQ